MVCSLQAHFHETPTEALPNEVPQYLEVRCSIWFRCLRMCVCLQSVCLHTQLMRAAGAAPLRLPTRPLRAIGTQMLATLLHACQHKQHADMVLSCVLYGLPGSRMRTRRGP
jgi:hypothetical protein